MSPDRDSLRRIMAAIRAEMGTGDDAIREEILALLAGGQALRRGKLLSLVVASLGQTIDQRQFTRVIDAMRERGEIRVDRSTAWVRRTIPNTTP